MLVPYDLSRIPALAGLELAIENRDGELQVHAQGPPTELVAPYLRNYLGWLSSRGSLGSHRGAEVYSLYLPPVPSLPHARMVEGIIKTFFLKIHTPQAVTIAVTDDCQFGCIHCSVPGRQSGHSRLNREDLLRVVRQSLELGVSNITFTGGEPLLNPDLETLIAAVPPDKALVQVFSNGFVLDNSRAARLKEAGAFAVQISLDSPDPGEHDRLRNMHGAFDGVCRAVEAALQADLFVGLSTYATNSSLNQGSLELIYQLARNWGAHELSVFDVIPTGRLLHKNEVLLTPKSRQILRRLERRCNSHRRGPTSLVTQNWSNSAHGFAKSFGCLAGNYQFHISAFGEFMPCDFTPISFGNVRQYSIEQLWGKLINHPAWCSHQNDCRMQSVDFRSRYIDPLPPGIELPAPIEMLDQLAGQGAGSFG